MERLLMIAPAPVLRTGTGYTLDKKFITGMALHCRLWQGKMDCLLREGAQNIPFGAQAYTPDMPFGLKVLGQHEAITHAHLDGYDVIYCGIDSADNLPIIDIALPRRPRIVATIEYTLRTRLQAAWLDNRQSMTKRLRTMLWLLRQEPQRRRFIRQADGLQTNGYPAYESYRRLNAHTLLYLDNRMTSDLFATQAERDARASRVAAGAPLRLVYSGRLEPMKGAQDLIPIARALAARGAAFHLDIFGNGHLAAQIASDIARHNLADHVTLHDPVDFETGLVPYLRENCDIYLCCHRQSDPSCSYIENMGCGLAVVGYGNQMWAALQQASDAGWTAPLGNRDKIVDIIHQLDTDRAGVIARCDNALAFAKSHDFQSEFQKRMDHLAKR